MKKVEQLLDYSEVATWLKVSPVTLRRWVSEGHLPHKKIGRSVRFAREEIERWIESQSKPAKRGEG